MARIPMFRRRALNKREAERISEFYNGKEETTVVATRPSLPENPDHTDDYWDRVDAEYAEAKDRKAQEDAGK